VQAARKAREQAAIHDAFEVESPDEQYFKRMIEAMMNGTEVAKPSPPRKSAAQNGWCDDGAEGNKGASAGTPPVDEEDGDSIFDTEEYADLERIPYILPNQKQMHLGYNSKICQISVAALIFANFVVNAAEAQTAEGEGVDIYLGFEYFFTGIFAIELAGNYYAHYHYPFFRSLWNWFDLLVVTVSLVAIMVPDLPGISVLRLFRAFRVFRLFKRLESLRKIMACLASAVPGCASAFAIVVLVTAIYSILCVEFFGVEWPYNFGSFSKSMFTLFQVMTGESWAEVIARPIIDVYPHAALLFISYILIVGIILVNVVVAVLLEKMTMDEEGAEDPHQAARKFMLATLAEFGEAINTRMLAQEKTLQKLQEAISSKYAVSNF